MGFVALMVVLVLAFGAIGGGATYVLVLAPDDEASSGAPASLAIDDAPASAGAEPSSPNSGSEAEEAGGDQDGAVAAEPAPEALPDVSTHELEEEIAAMLIDFHEAVVDKRFHDAWAMLSQRKQEQIEREDGFAAWSKAQASLSPYLEPWGLEVSAEALDRSKPVVQVRVTGMGWTKPGASCAEWSGLTWVRYELGGWMYDPGYSTTPQRERRWQPRYEELLGAGC